MKNKTKSKRTCYTFHKTNNNSKKKRERQQQHIIALILYAKFQSYFLTLAKEEAVSPRCLCHSGIYFIVYPTRRIQNTSHFKQKATNEKLLIIYPFFCCLLHTNNTV